MNELMRFKIASFGFWFEIHLSIWPNSNFGITADVSS